mmetsp:Transcript_31831/g.54979  ORF Transcript_31831/g.54979 Transcript_31831/m.54979 type:complete len:108 (-) Transcript_31831:365-688(-)
MGWGACKGLGWQREGYWGAHHSPLRTSFQHSTTAVAECPPICQSNICQQQQRFILLTMLRQGLDHPEPIHQLVLRRPLPFTRQRSSRQLWAACTATAAAHRKHSLDL